MDQFKNLGKVGHTGTEAPHATSKKTVAIKLSTEQEKILQDRLLGFTHLKKYQVDKGYIYLPTGLLDGDKLNKNNYNLYNWYLTQILESKNTERQVRIKEHKFMDMNSTEISMALDTYADEAVQLGKVSNGILAESGDKSLKLLINKLLKKLKLNNINYIRDLARQIAKFGDKPLGVEITENGVEGVHPIDVEMFDRIERYVHIDDNGQISFYDEQNKHYSYRKKDQKLETGSIFGGGFRVSDYKPYLLGFKLGNQILPPWNCIHFRLYCSEAPYYPYGRAIIESVRATYKHLLSDEILMSLVRATKFNRINFELDITESIDDPMMLYQKLDSLRESYNEHAVGEATRARNPSFTAEVWTIKTTGASLTAKALNTEIKADRIDDIEYRRDKLYTGLRLPKDYLLASQAFKIEGDALIQEDLKLARLIYTLQSAILSGIVRLVQIHLVAIGEEDKINNFSLSLPYPVPNYNLMELKNQQERLKYVAEFAKLLTETLGIEKLPMTTLKMLLVDMAHMDQTLISKIELDLKNEGVKAEGGVGADIEVPEDETPASIEEPVVEPEPEEVVAEEPGTELEPEEGGEEGEVVASKKISADKRLQRISEGLNKKLDKEAKEEIREEVIDKGRHVFSASQSLIDDPILLGDDGFEKYQALLEGMESLSKSKSAMSAYKKSQEELFENANSGGTKKKDQE